MTTMDRFVLRDDQWDRIKDLLPGKAGDCGVTAKDNRLFTQAVLWMGRTGAPWHNVYVRFERWRETGVWQRVSTAVSRDPDMEELMIDSTIVRAHQHAAGAPKKAGCRQ
jgi:transposase